MAVTELRRFSVPHERMLKRAPAADASPGQTAQSKNTAAARIQLFPGITNNPGHPLVGVQDNRRGRAQLGGRGVFKQAPSKAGSADRFAGENGSWHCAQRLL